MRRKRQKTVAVIRNSYMVCFFQYFLTYSDYSQGKNKIPSKLRTEFQLTGSLHPAMILCRQQGFNGFRVLASLLHRRRSMQVNQTLR